METRCEHCGQECWIEDESAGEQLLCPRCDRSFAATTIGERFQPLASLVEELLAEIPPASAAAHAQAEPVVPTGHPARGRRRRAKQRFPKPARRLLLAAVAVSVLVGMCVGVNKLVGSLALTRHVSQAGVSVEWRADPALLAQLGEPRGVDRFSLRLPADFKRLTVLPDPSWMPHYGGHFVGLMWRGPLGHKAELYCTVYEFPSDEPPTGGLEKAAERFFDWLNKNATFTRFSHGAGEVGQLNGRYCIRAGFSGRYRMRSPARVEPREGVVYVMLDENRQISLYTLCSPDERETHELMGASLLTWQEMGGKPDTARAVP
jgi:hypothetical protein